MDNWVRRELCAFEHQPRRQKICERKLGIRVDCKALENILFGLRSAGARVLVVYVAHQLQALSISQHVLLCVSGQCVLFFCDLYPDLTKAAISRSHLNSDFTDTSRVYARIFSISLPFYVRYDCCDKIKYVFFNTDKCSSNTWKMYSWVKQNYLKFYEKNYIFSEVTKR